METTLKVTGMTCGMCVQHVTDALQGVAGVQSATVDLSSGEAKVQHDDSTDPTAFIEAVAKAGYQAHRVVNEGR
jgi:copper chaperone CopZ